MGNFLVVGPNEGLAVSGGCRNETEITIGGWAWAWWGCSNVERLSLEVMTLNPHCDCVETKEGPALTVTGVAQVKFLTEDKLLRTAMEQFLGKSTAQIQEVLVQTLDGHLRAILGTLTVEEIYQDREKFAALVREVASPDVGKMGVEILSFTIKELRDNIGYLSSLGKKKTAEVRRDADIGVALATRDAGIKESEAFRATMEVKYVADTAIADSDRLFLVQKAIFNQEVNTKIASAELAYDLEAAKVRQAIKAEDVQIQVVERRKAIEVEEQEIKRKENELIAVIRKPADAERFKMETIASAAKTKIVAEAHAEAEAIKLIGEAEASAIAARGNAEAEGMRMKAEAYRRFGDAALMSMVLETLPKIAAEIAAPLSKVEKIVMVDGAGNNATGDIIQLAAQLPPALQALTGTDLNKVLQALAGKATGKAPAAATASS